MIKSITLYKEKDNFTSDLYPYKRGKVTFDFTDGVNIITGRNGSGKSVLLNIIKTSCGINRDATYPRMPHPMDLHGIFDDKWKTIPELIRKNLSIQEYPSTDIVWDGAIIHHLVPDFFAPKNLWELADSPYPNETNILFGSSEILAMMLSKGSKGERTIHLLNKLYQLPVEYDGPLINVNDVWIKASDVFQEWIHSFPQEKGKPTLLIDELDSHLDIDNQNIYWKFINSLTKKWQVIVVSHSIFAFKQEGLNDIPLNPEYLKTVRDL